MPRIEFIRDELYESEGRNLGPLFLAGAQYTCTEAFAERWVRRGAAEVVGRGEPPAGEAFALVKAAARTEAEPAIAKRAAAGAAEPKAAAAKADAAPVAPAAAERSTTQA